MILNIIFLLLFVYLWIFSGIFVYLLMKLADKSGSQNPNHKSWLEGGNRTWGITVLVFLGLISLPFGLLALYDYHNNT